MKDTLEPVSRDVPGYHIYRNSSMSFGLRESNQELKELLLSKLISQKPKDLLHEAGRNYFHSANKGLLKRFFAYLLSLDNPQIELLIVDEGHNFKHGLGDSDTDEVSDRNNVATRFFGLKRNSEEDKIIFDDFPELRKLVRPKVEKLIVLSATPKTYSLLEFKKQLDCFLPSHVLSDARSEKDVESKLSQFLIRGKMEYELNGRIYSRNQCRLEHRRGNVEKTENAGPLQIQDNEQSLIMGLLQYNTIKHLNAKHNDTFELGMLAGFETFKFDQQKKVDEQEFEETRTKKITSSQDEAVVSGIINSYKNEFGVLPPHPKQDALVDAIFSEMKNCEKSLVFVRRVASAYELERRLLDKWEKEVIYKELQSKWKNILPSKELNSLLNSYEIFQQNRVLNEKLDSIFNGLASRIISIYKVEHIEYKKKVFENTEYLNTALYYVFNNYKSLERGQEFYDFLIKQVSLGNFKSEFIECGFQLVEETKPKWINLLGGTDDSMFDDDEDEAYFFHSYFRQPTNKYFRKSRIYQTDWFDLNFYLLNNHFRIADFELGQLRKDTIHTKTKDASDLKEVQEVFLKYLKEEEYQAHQIFEEEYPPALVSKVTLITKLLLSVFESEFSAFLKRMVDKKKRKAEIIHEIKTLATIIKSSIRNGVGFLPLFIADNAKSGDLVTNYISMISDTESCFYDVIKEVRTIINDYELLQAVNFPEKDNQKDIESKLIFQSPVKGMSGIKKNKEKVATQFRMPGYPYVLITTDIFREGEDLHTYCQNIYHYGIAWNCSDMEQRTGRIDRINSLSNRKMLIKQRNDFDEKIHVFFPYLQKTLEVNQVNKLFIGLNDFTKAFDIVDSIREDGIASVKSSIENLPEKLDVFMKSKFEHYNFKGYSASGKPLNLNSLIGSSRHDIEKDLIKISEKISSSGTFHLVPGISYEEFRIIGDYNLVNRRNRRGPFRVLIKNDIIPGQFLIEASSYLFKASSRVQKDFRELRNSGLIKYDMIDVDDFHAFSMNYQMNDTNYDTLIKDLVDMVYTADYWEDKITKGQDLVIFG